MTDTNSVQACKGWQCLTRVPNNPEQAGWREGYCPECLDELARDEIRAERQDYSNEVERPTPITDAMAFDILHNPFEIKKCSDGSYVFSNVARTIERLLSEAREQRDRLAKDRDEWKQAHDHVCKELASCEEQRDQNAALCEEARQQRDTLADALKAIEWSNNSEWQSNCAKCALATLNPNQPE